MALMLAFSRAVLLVTLLTSSVATAAQSVRVADGVLVTLDDSPRAVASQESQARFPSREDDTESLVRTNTVLDPLEDMRKALDVMQSTWFELWVGKWPTSIDWTGAVLSTHVVATLSTLSKALDVDRRSGSVTDAHLAAIVPIENELNLFFAHTTAYYFGEDAFALRNEAFDDMLWVVLGWLESVKFINIHSRLHYRPVIEQTKPWHGSQFIDAFAHRARVFYDITTQGWDTDLCGGGMTWNPYLTPYKNAITNQLFITASISMYLYFPGDTNSSPFSKADDDDEAYAHDPKYLQAAIDGYDWLKQSNMTNDKGLYVDGFHIKDWGKNHSIGTGECDERNEMVYTYNQGVVLSGLRGLWEATGNHTYLEDGHKLVRNTVAASGWLLDAASASPNSDEWHGLGRRGILEEVCDSNSNCDQNGHTFKGIYFHHLTLFCEPLPSEPLVPGKTHTADKALALLHRQSCKDYALWVAHNARAAVGTRDDKGRFGSWWGQDSGSGYATKASMPVDAVDYRNNASELLRDSWLLPDNKHSMFVGGSAEADNYFYNSEDAKIMDTVCLPFGKRHRDGARVRAQDVNDRGRGRTVESQSGGIAVLRALWELLEQT